jgi:hypothetical protein
LFAATLVASGLGVVAAAPSMASGSVCGPGPNPGETVCTWTGSSFLGQDFPVPAGVTQVTFEVYGGDGAGRPLHNLGGAGAVVTATVAVTPGARLSVAFGTAGGHGANGLQSGGDLSAGSGGGHFGGSGAGFGGGGYSYVRASVDGAFLLVAGGGGGQGGGPGGIGGAGGDGGAVAGSGTSVTGATGGGGGTSDAGGAGGDTSSVGILDCAAGHFDGFDGRSFGGGNAGTSDCAGGGGGGSGWFGGGGGGAAEPVSGSPIGAGGGAGSSYIADDPSITDGSVSTRSDARPVDDNPLNDDDPRNGKVVATFVVPDTSQSIDFAPLANRTYGDAAFTPSASATSGLPVSFTAAGDCTSDGGTVTVTGAGSCTVTAHQAGDDSHAAAADVPQSFDIAQAELTITAQNKTRPYNTASPPFTASYSGFVNGDGPDSLDSPPVLSTTATMSSDVGPYPISASGAADPNYHIGYVPGTLTVTQASQTIDFAPLGNRTYGDPAFTPSATATSGLPVSFTAGGHCTSDDATVTITGAGSCTVTAQQAGDDNYAAAADVPQSFDIARAGQTINFTAPGTGTVGGTFTPAPTATSGLTVTTTIDPASTLGACSLSAGVVTFTGSGSCIIDANQAGNLNYLPAPQVRRTVTISYLFGKFLSPLPKTTLAKSASSIPVKFTLGDSHGSLSPSAASALAASGRVQATLSGPGTAGPVVVSALCTWDAQHGNFQCNLKTPKGLVTTAGSSYYLSAQVKNGSTFANATGTDNPEIVFFK